MWRSVVDMTTEDWRQAPTDAGVLALPHAMHSSDPWGTVRDDCPDCVLLTSQGTSGSLDQSR